MLIRVPTLILLLLASMPAQARPVSYAGGWMAMTMNDGMENAASVSYSPTAYDAFGVRAEYQRNDDSRLHTVTYNHLIQRWNKSDSQANFYLMTGAGFGDDHGETAPAGFAGVEADWESRRYYVSYENRFLASKVNEQYFDQKARVGIAPYVGEYGSVHTWLMLQVQHNPCADDPVVVTPLVRLFNSDFLTEVGYGSNKTLLLNATWQF